MDYLGHVENGREQKLIEHLQGTAELCGKFASVFGAESLGKRCGILHDIGKYSEKFQRRIRGSGEQVDHSTAGALEAFHTLRDVPAAYCIAGHHTGLPDLGNKKIDSDDCPTFFGRMKRRIGAKIEDYGAYKTEVAVPRAVIPQRSDSRSAYFFIRMLYSCLVDADYLDTEAFISDNRVSRGGYDELKLLWERLENSISPWWDAKTQLNRKRCEILRAMIDRAGCSRGLFTLTVPTGGGKTVSSMAFALRHAVKNDMRRVIYVIPYNSIIEQTQEEFERRLGAENIVAHYSNADFVTDENAPEEDRRRLAAENWDAPIILTTAVQFFESLYANRPSRCRKLHNIAGSVIIFDEAQMLPVPYMIPCLYAVAELIKNYGCTAVLCTATQPSLGELLSELLPEYTPTELCPNVEGMYEFFRRVTYAKEGKLSDEEVARRLMEEKQALCIVNNRKQAQAIYALLKGDGTYHLSTAMTAYDRRYTLKQIRARLKSGQNCLVVSTSLIEAGVDVDFPAVYRSVAGLDSIIQAGGRCNREGRRPANKSVVHIFETEQKPPEILRQNIAAAERVIRDFEDVSAPDAVKSYFDFLLYKLKDRKELDKREIMQSMEAGEFASVAERFHIIENSDYTVYVPVKEGEQLVRRLREYGPSRSLLRKLGQYAVGVHPAHFRTLVETGAAERLSGNTAILCDMEIYSEKTGLALSAEEGKAIFI